MGYYANGSGIIDFVGVLTNELYESVIEILSENFNVGGVREYRNFNREPHTTIDIWTDDKYFEDGVISALHRVASLAPLSEHSIVQYVGEDNTFWRFVFKDGKWYEQNGRVVYGIPGREI